MEMSDQEFQNIYTMIKESSLIKVRTIKKEDLDQMEIYPYPALGEHKLIGWCFTTALVQLKSGMIAKCNLFDYIMGDSDKAIKDVVDSVSEWKSNHPQIFINYPLDYYRP